MHRHNLSVLRLMFLGLVALAVVGCMPKDAIETTAPPRALAPTVKLSGLCLEVKAAPAGLDEALAPIPADSPIIAAMADYKRMRDQSRACHETAGK